MGESQQQSQSLDPFLPFELSEQMIKNKSRDNREWMNV